MADLSRRSFVTLTAGGILLPQSEHDRSADPGNNQFSLHEILASAEIPVDGLDRPYLLERRGADRTWIPSARILRGSCR